jgi:hypothetical protein
MDEAGKRVEAVVNEISAVDLGDSRLNFRARHVGARLGQSPGLSFPAALATEAALEGFYRFLADDKVTVKAILKPHAEATVARAAEHRTVLAIHDTTEFQFAGEGRSRASCPAPPVPRHPSAPPVRATRPRHPSRASHPTPSC